MKHKNTKAHEIPESVKEKVYQRDEESCILCRGVYGYPGVPNAHYIGRAQEGLGTEENIVTLCPVCHDQFDFHDDDGAIKEYIRKYLELHYPGYPDSDRVYDKWRYLK